MTTHNLIDALTVLLHGYGVDTVFSSGAEQGAPWHAPLKVHELNLIEGPNAQAAIFMADGYARATGRAGVCLLKAGSSLTAAAAAVAQVFTDSTPMLIVTTTDGSQSPPVLSRQLCRLDMSLRRPDELPDVLQRAFNLFAAASPGPVQVTIPERLLGSAYAGGMDREALDAPPGPDSGTIEEAARQLATAQRPLILVGGGAVSAASGVTALAEKLDAPVLNTASGKGICPWGHPQAVGGSPSLPSLARAIEDADVVLAIGTGLDETDYDLLMTGAPQLPAGLIRLDIDTEKLKRGVQPAVALCCDARAGVRALNDRLEAHAPASAERASALRDAVRQDPLYHPEIGAFLRALQLALPDAVVVGDATRPTYHAAWQLESRAPRRYFQCVTGMPTLGYALPAALGARLGTGGAVVALIGDPGFQATADSLATGVRLGVGLPVVVWHNDVHEKTANALMSEGRGPVSTRNGTAVLSEAASMYGCGYRRVTDTAELQAAVEEAAAAGGPTVIEAEQRHFMTSPSGG